MKMRLMFKAVSLILLGTVAILQSGCSSGGGGGGKSGEKSGNLTIKIDLNNPNGRRVYGVFVNLDYGGATVEGTRKSLTITGNSRGESTWDVISRELTSGADDKLWWKNSTDSILHLKAKGEVGIKSVDYKLDSGDWITVNNINTVSYTSPTTPLFEIGIDFKIADMGIEAGEHSIAVRYSLNTGGVVELPAEKFKILVSEGVSAYAVGAAPSD